MTTQSPREAVYLQADGQEFELFYLQQPGGGAIQVYDNGGLVERISTDGVAEETDISTTKPSTAITNCKWKRWITRPSACSAGPPKIPPA